MLSIKQNQRVNNQLIAGVDEAGRGPLVGSVIAGVVIFDSNRVPDGITDSKRLSAKKRAQLFDVICRDAQAWSMGEVSAEEIDQLNIHHASLLAMKRAVDGLSIQPDKVLVDGCFVPPGLSMPACAIVKGDLLEPVIGAASILAKVYRDRQMEQLAEDYPGYGFEKHKGYPTRQHLQALVKLGPCPVHRRSFRPVREAEHGN